MTPESSADSFLSASNLAEDFPMSRHVQFKSCLVKSCLMAVSWWLASLACAADPAGPPAAAVRAPVVMLPADACATSPDRSAEPARPSPPPAHHPSVAPRFDATYHGALVDMSRRADPALEYPPEAIRNGVTGIVVLLILVGADSSVRKVEVERSSPQGVFDSAAIAYGKTRTFHCAMADGKPVPDWIRLPIEFKL